MKRRNFITQAACINRHYHKIEYQKADVVISLLNAHFAACFMIISCLAYSSTLKMEAVCSSETSVDLHWTTRRYIPKDTTLHKHRCENLEAYKNAYFSI
jgi:hypothetical protein